MPAYFLAGRRGLAALSVWSAFSAAAVAQTGPVTAPPASEGAVSLELDIIAKQLDVARNQIQPTLGASLYDFRRESIEATPQGDNTPFNQLVLQAPGVTQDSFGQLHVRGDHANLQFRINGVQLPEGINVFGQTLQTRLANSISLITGSLPAQYGFRTAGILDIQTKTGTTNPGGSVSMYGGSHEWLQPSLNTAAGWAPSTTSSPGSICITESASRTRPAAFTRCTTGPIRAAASDICRGSSIRTPA